MPGPRTTTIGLNFLATFLVAILQNNNRHTSARAQKIFPIRNMRPLSIREAPDPGVRGSFHRLWKSRYEQTVQKLQIMILTLLMRLMIARAYVCRTGTHMRWSSWRCTRDHLCTGANDVIAGAPITPRFSHLIHDKRAVKSATSIHDAKYIYVRYYQY